MKGGQSHNIVEYSIKPNYRPKRPKINSLPWLIYLYEPNIQHVYSPYHYCNVCKARGLMRNVTAGCYAAKVKQIRALTDQLSPKTSDNYVTAYLLSVGGLRVLRVVGSQPCGFAVVLVGI